MGDIIPVPADNRTDDGKVLLMFAVKKAAFWMLITEIPKERQYYKTDIL
jgi:hypothetical protein